MTFWFFQKKNGLWCWWLVSKFATVKAHCAREFPNKGECLRDIRDISGGMESADIREGNLGEAA